MSRPLVWALLLVAACKADPSPPRPEPKASGSAPAPSRLELVKAKDHVPVEIIVDEELARAKTTGQQVILYVGAPWCEPCRYFHEAAAAGKLDEAFPELRVIEFNLDDDEARLEVAGCRSRMIPLFARVTSDGKCHPEHRIMGSVKGPGAIANITPRLRSLLATP